MFRTPLRQARHSYQNVISGESINHTIRLRSMTSESLVEEKRKAILEDGFFAAQDALLGERIQKLKDDHVPSASAAGLLFCKTNVLDNPQIRPVIEAFFEWSSLGLYRFIGASPDNYTFLSNPNCGVEVLTFQLFAKGSSARYWQGSHLHWLNPIRCPNTLLRVPPARLTNLGLTSIEIPFEDGGFSIMDARIAFEITKGSAITFAFAIKSAIEKWAPMKLPKGRNLEQVVASMESANLGVNVAYIEIQGVRNS